MNNQNELEHPLNWDDPIEKDSDFESYPIFPEGDYRFVVKKMDRARYQPKPGAKLPACPQAILDLEITDDQGRVSVIKHNLYLHTQTEGLLSAFFVGIGQKKPGQKIHMNWKAVEGSTGVAHVVINRYKSRSGEDRENNQVKYFLDPNDQPKSAQPAQPAYQQPAYQQPQAQQYQQPQQQQPVQPQQPQQSQQPTTPFPTQNGGGFTAGQF